MVNGVLASLGTVTVQIHCLETPKTDLHDVKGWCDRQSGRYPSRRGHVPAGLLRMTTTFPILHVRNICEFVKADILVVLDGRRWDIGGKLRKGSRAPAKSCGHINKKPLPRETKTPTRNMI